MMNEETRLISDQGVSMSIRVDEAASDSLRLRIAIVLFRLGAWISGIYFEVADGDQ